MLETLLLEKQDSEAGENRLKFLRGSVVLLSQCKDF